MARSMILSFPAADPIALLPTTVAGGAATSSIVLANSYPVVFANFARTITLTSTDNLSGVNFTITGTDTFGNSISEVLVGPNNATVTSAKQYYTVTNISCDGAYTNFSIGTGSTGTSQWIKVNTLSSSSAITLASDVVGTINYTVNQTVEPVGAYIPVGPYFKYVSPGAPILLGNDPLATTNLSKVVVVTVPSTAGLVTGNFVTISGAATTHAITAAQLNITASITVLTATTFSFTSNGTADETNPGGGAAVKYAFPAQPLSFAVTAALTGATTNQIYTLTTPTTAFQALVNSSSAGGAITLTILQQGIH